MANKFVVRKGKKPELLPCTEAEEAQSLVDKETLQTMEAEIQGKRNKKISDVEEAFPDQKQQNIIKQLMRLDD